MPPTLCNLPRRSILGNASGIEPGNELSVFRSVANATRPDNRPSKMTKRETARLVKASRRMTIRKMMNDPTTKTHAADAHRTRAPPRRNGFNRQSSRSPPIALTTRNASNPGSPHSRPLLYCLKPPNGADASQAGWLIITCPARSFEATRLAAPKSLDCRYAARP